MSCSRPPPHAAVARRGPFVRTRPTARAALGETCGGSNGSALVVDWPADRRAELEGTLAQGRTGAVLVKYDCPRVQVLTGTARRVAFSSAMLVRSRRAIGSTAQSGSTPKRLRCFSMKSIIPSVGGRAPPVRNTRTRDAEFRWRVSARAPRARASSVGHAPTSLDRCACPNRAAPAEPICAASLSCTRVSRRPRHSSHNR